MGYLRFRHSHGGTGCGSTHNHFFALRASRSNPSPPFVKRGIASVTHPSNARISEVGE
jgi:hypothetical protein